VNIRGSWLKGCGKKSENLKMLLFESGWQKLIAVAPLLLNAHKNGISFGVAGHQRTSCWL
jgi:hypothetical protein